MSNPEKVMKDPERVIMTFSEFRSGAQTTDLFQQVAKEIAKEQSETIIIDSRARRDEEWSLLANQVVGGEVAVLPARKATPPTADCKSNSCGAGSDGALAAPVKP
jgi:hypothetical protein